MFDSKAYCTSVCSCARTVGRSCDGEVVVGSYCSGQSDRFVRFDFDVERLAFECKQRLVLAFPLLEVTLIVAVVQADFTAQAFALRSQALFGGGDKNPSTSCPA